jgi:multicomponent Na+:H+ antiporter subunit C
MYNYSFSILLFCVGLYIVLASKDQMRKLFGLSFLQTAVLWFYISLGKVYGGRPPILQDDGGVLFSNPLPQVLMLTAIVVGLATLSLGFILVIKIKSIED